jgi:NAD(P)H-dependent FMN reductase
MTALHIQVIVGSVREGRTSLPVAEWAVGQLRNNPRFSVELIDLADWSLPMFALSKPPAMGLSEDLLQRRWAEKVAEADGYVFVFPEYNHGYPAVLKNALDYLYAEWSQKPAACVSFGNAGGARAVEQLRLVLVELQMAPLATALHIMRVGSKTTNGTFVGDERDVASFDRVLAQLRWWGAALRSARTLEGL